MEDMAQKFEEILNEYSRDDGSKWSAAALQRATDGTVNRSYINAFRRGQIKEPSFNKIVAISDAMGVPLDAWRIEE